MAHHLFTTCLLIALTGAASGQEVRQYRSTERVDPRDVANILDASKPAPAIKMRSIRLLDGAAAPTIDAAAAEAAAAAPPASALSLPVQFDFDSARILPAAGSQLDALARGIQLLPTEQTVVIQGHTDAHGSAAYNDQLSLRRAHAVKQYLVSVHGIAPQRLRTVGKGKDDPLPGLDPAAGENRRVQFSGER